MNFVGRYINDALVRRGNNVRFGNSYKVEKKNERYVVPIISTKRIYPNTELLVSYGRKYWGNNN